MKNINLPLVHLCLLVSVLLSCHEEPLVAPRRDASASSRQQSGIDVLSEIRSKTITHYGPAIPVAKGIVRTYVTLEPDGTPSSVGISISARVLENLPSDHFELSLKFPKHFGVTPFTHVTFGWNPNGHPPGGIYTVPHFDAHFNIISEDDRLQIPGIPPPYMDPAPDAIFLPPAYVQGPGVEPTMGAHWVDVLAPEFNGQLFTKTMVYGSYAGEVIFLEPMFTVAYLATHPAETIAIRQSQAVQQSGYYPATYSIVYHEHPAEFRISLDGLAFRASQ